MKFNIIAIACLIIFSITVYYYVDLRKYKHINNVQVNDTSKLAKAINI
jgi:hypothetical protein